jgi:alpha-beta hydrolase superfamily lysophospholipase
MDSVTTHDRLQLPLQRWLPSTPPRGAVLIVHGLGEHIDRYRHVAAFLNGAGWAVWGWDQRGHGRAPGRRGSIRRPDDLLQDLAAVIDVVRAAQPAGPLVLLGHSMGGLVASRFVAEGLVDAPAAWYRPLDGLVLSSPALDPGTRAWQKAALATLGRLLPGLPAHNGLKPAWISRDPAVVQAYRQDPLVHSWIVPRLARFIIDGGEQVRALAPRWRTPTLLIYAGADRCVAPRGSDAFAQAAPAAVLQVRRFDGLFHEIFNEPEQRAVLQHLGDWLARRFSAGGDAAARPTADPFLQSVQTHT